MKAKTLFYTGLGFATFKVGKLLGKRRVRAAVQDLRKRDSRREAGRHA